MAENRSTMRWVVARLRGLVGGDSGRSPRPDAAPPEPLPQPVAAAPPPTRRAPRPRPDGPTPPPAAEEQPTRAVPTERRPRRAAGGVAPARRPRSADGSGRESLTIRWFTPRGRAAREEVLLDLRYQEGRHLGEIVGDVRRPGASPQRLDLRGIDLAHEELAAARLAGAEMAGASLEGCDLVKADLRGCDLSRSKLSGARLRGADLRGADLRGADLTSADLTEARLDGARVDGARLQDASLRRVSIVDVDLTHTDLRGVDLSQVYREPIPFEDRRPTVRGRTLGRPPASEPRPPTRRIVRQRAPGSGPAPRPASGPSPRPASGPVRRPASGPARRPAPTAATGPQGSGGRRRPAGQVVPYESVRIAREAVTAAGAEHEDFDAAVAALMGLRRSVERIAVVVDGEERLLFTQDLAAARVRVG